MDADERSEFQRQLDELSRRVARLEAHQFARVGVAPSPAPEPPPVARPVPIPPRAISAAQPSSPPLADAAPPPRTAPDSFVKRIPSPRPAAPKPARSVSLESLIGGKGFAALGALVIVAGLALALKLAYDQGWLGRMPAQLKCLSVAGLGVALLGAGEWARRKINALASAGLSAAGVGALFTSAYFAHHTYGLYGAPTAYTLLGLSALVGVFVAARARLALVAGVAIVCGYLSPLLLRAGGPDRFIMPAHLLALLCVGLSLSVWLGNSTRGFRLLRPLVWWGTMLLGLAWVLESGLGAPLSACAFIAGVWTCVHAELALSARRAPGPATATFAGWRPIATSLSTTGWATWLGAVAAKRAGADLDWLAPGALAAASACLALVLAGGLRVLRDTPRNDSERLGAGLAAQAGGLLFVTVALGVGGWMQAAVWLAMGVAAFVAARWMLSAPLAVYGAIVLGVATGRLMLLEWWTTSSAATGAAVLGLFLSPWTGLVAIGAGAWLTAGALLRVRGPAGWRWGAHACLGIGMALAWASLLHSNAEPFSLIAAAIVVAALTGVLARWVRSSGLGALALAGLGLATVALFAHRFWSVDRAGEGVAAIGLVLTRWTALVWGAAGALAAGWLLLRRAASGWRAVGSACLACAFVLAALGLLHEASSQRAMLAGAMVVAFAAGATGRAIGSRTLGALAPMMLGVAGLLAAPQVWNAPGAPGVEALGLVLTRWTALGAFAAVVWFGVGLLQLRREDGASPTGASACFTAGVLSILVALHHPSAAPASIVIAWAVVGASLVAARGLLPRLRLELLALWALGLTVTFWAMRFVLDGWTATADARSPGLHPGLLSALVTSVGLAWTARVISRAHGSPRRPLWAVAATLCGALVFTATSFEAARAALLLADDRTARLAAVSIWWGVFGVGLVALGFVKRLAPVRHTGLTLVMIALVKTVTIDLAGVSPVWRVAAFIGLGLLMLGVAVAYAKLSATAGDGARAGGEGAPGGASPALCDRGDATAVGDPDAARRLDGDNEQVGVRDRQR